MLDGEAPRVGVEHQRLHTVERSQIRQPAVIANERPRPRDHLRLDLEIVPGGHEMCDRMEAARHLGCQVPVVVEVQAGIEQDDVGRRRQAGQEPADEPTVLLRLRKAIVEVETDGHESSGSSDAMSLASTDGNRVNAAKFSIRLTDR